MFVESKYSDAFIGNRERNEEFDCLVDAAALLMCLALIEHPH